MTSWFIESSKVIHFRYLRHITVEVLYPRQRSYNPENPVGPLPRPKEVWLGRVGDLTVNILSICLETGSTFLRVSSFITNLYVDLLLNRRVIRLRVHHSTHSVDVQPLRLIQNLLPLYVMSLKNRGNPFYKSSSLTVLKTNLFSTTNTHISFTFKFRYNVPKQLIQSL